jgi:hypothetical protein
MAMLTRQTFHHFLISTDESGNKGSRAGGLGSCSCWGTVRAVQSNLTGERSTKTVIVSRSEMPTTLPVKPAAGDRNDQKK